MSLCTRQDGKVRMKMNYECCMYCLLRSAYSIVQCLSSWPENVLVFCMYFFHFMNSGLSLIKSKCGGKTDFLTSQRQNLPLPSNKTIYVNSVG